MEFKSNKGEDMRDIKETIQVIKKLIEEQKELRSQQLKTLISLTSEEESTAIVRSMCTREMSIFESVLGTVVNKRKKDVIPVIYGRVRQVD